MTNIQVTIRYQECEASGKRVQEIFVTRQSPLISEGTYQLTDMWGVRRIIPLANVYMISEEAQERETGQ